MCLLRHLPLGREAVHRQMYQTKTACYLSSWKGAANPRTQELEMEDLAKILGRDSEVGKERLLRIFANLNTDLQGGISFDELQDFIRGPKATTPGVGKKDN